MRTRIAAVTIAATATVALAACSSSSDNPNMGAPQNPAAAYQSIFLQALTAVDPDLAADPDAISKGRTQCLALSEGDPAGHAAAMRFSTRGHALSDDQGAAINKALQLTICPPK
jgi:hypothetical protein